MRTSPTGRPAARRARRRTFLAMAGLILATLGPIGSAHAAAFQQIGEGRIAYPSVGGFPALIPGPDALLFVNDGCQASQWDGKFAVAINVEKYRGNTLEFRLESTGIVVNSATMEIFPYVQCATTAANGDPRDNYSVSWNQQRARITIRPTTMWLLVWPGGTASGIVFTAHKCTSGC